MKIITWKITLCAATALSLAFVSSAVARDETTAPGQHVNNVVLIENAGFTVGNSGRLPRGVNVTFFVKNLTKSAKNFKILGKATKPIAPGHQEKLTITLAKRGVYPYESTLNPTKNLRGLFDVY